MREAVIVSAVCTPLGKFNGMLSSIGVTDLGGIAIREAIRRAGIKPNQIDEVIMGQVLTCGYQSWPFLEGRELGHIYNSSTGEMDCGIIIRLFPSRPH